MIVKNESHIIANTLAHLLKHFPISYWVIDDTGSTDGTQQIIRDFFAARGISGELHETAWEDFGYNRSKALEHAFNKTDYALVWDADDSVEGDFKFPQTLGADVYSFIFGNAGGFRYNRNQLFNNRKRWRYVGVLHEYPECIDREESKVHVSGAYYFVSGKSGARSQDPDKYRKDAAALERGLEKEPGNTRYAFYCANSYKDAGMHDKAIEKYKKVLEMNGWVEEKYLACLHIFELSGKKPENLHYLVEATKYSPERLEAVFELIQHYCVAGMNRVAAAYYSLIRDYYENRFATDDVSRFLFVKKEIGDFFLPYMMLIVSLKNDDKPTAYKMADMIMSRRYALSSEWHIRNAFFNMQFMYDWLKPDLGFLQRVLSYRYQLGFTLDDDANKSIEALINKHRDLLAAPIKWKHEPRCTDEVKIFFSITTCKRYDLFERTMNSLLRTWRDADKIDYFFCVDDNSSKTDRDKMRKKYPFFKYHMKGPTEKGHRESMNIIWNKLNELKPKYWIHMEDDWLFFYEDEYVSRATTFLDKHQTNNIHQILFNRNYAELYEWDIIGGQRIEPGFLLHERSAVIPVGRRTNAYWPHYSFRPSMIRVAPILELGNYDSPNTFFERDYADRYTARGYKSAFFDVITCFHTGKLTSDKSGQNAYSLNNENQFIKKTATYVINLERRPDRRENVNNEFAKAGTLDFSYFNAIDAQTMKPTTELVHLFKGNDFGDRRTFIACAMSHYRLWQQLAQEPHVLQYHIFEDDITILPQYKEKRETIYAYLDNNKDVDFLFLGYHSRNRDVRDTSGGFMPLDMNAYIGGFFSYIITKRGAEKILAFIKENGIKHGIDYLVKIVPGLRSVSVQPHIVHSEWVDILSSPVDSDIQRDYNTILLDEKFVRDKWIFYKELDSIGNDICCKGRKTHNELMVNAENTTGCVAFNTLGFLKHKVEYPLVSVPFFGKEDGIYVLNSNNTIGIKLVGGLGNQLFQIAAAYAFSRRHGLTLKLSEKIHGIPTRPSYWDSILTEFKKYTTSDSDIMGDVWVEPHFHYEEIPSHSQQLQGYFQSRRYFSDYEDELRKMIMLPDVSDVDIMSCAVHIRRGDYLSNTQFHGILQKDYFERAMHVINEKTGAAHFTIYTDDPQWCHAQCWPFSITIVENKSDIETLSFMSKHIHYIMSNSSFSWWAVWLSQTKGCVVAPSCWWGPDGPQDWQDIYDANWIRINNNGKYTWYFHPELDSINYDIQRVSGDIINAAEKRNDCIAINTLGFMKTHVSYPLQSSIYMKAVDGIYIRKPRVCMLTNWCSSEQLVRDNKRMYNDHSFTLTANSEEADYWLIFNRPPVDAKYDPKRSLIFRMEPWCNEPWQTWGAKTWGIWAKPDPSTFMYVHDFNKSAMGAFWLLDYTCRELFTIDMLSDMKENIISSILSEKNFDPGHKHRLALLRLAEDKGGLPLKIFGRENYHGLAAYAGPTTGPKENYIRPYKYYFMCENNAESGYITEKLWEPILCESLCFYWGAPNAADYIDSRAFVQLDMTDYEAAYATIKKAVEEDWWSQRIQYIREAKQKILKELNIFAIVEKVLASQ